MQVKSSFFQFLKKFVGYTISLISFWLNLLAPTICEIKIEAHLRLYHSPDYSSAVCVQCSTKSRS